MADALHDKDLQKFYEDIFAMHATPGWAAWKEEVERYREQVSDIGSISEQHSLEFRRGQRDILTWFAAQEGIMRLAYEELLSQDTANEPEVE